MGRAGVMDFIYGVSIGPHMSCAICTLRTRYVRKTLNGFTVILKLKLRR